MKLDRRIVALFLSELFVLLLMFKWPAGILVGLFLAFSIITFDRPEILLSAFVFTLVLDAIYLPLSDRVILFPLTRLTISHTNLFFTDIFISIIVIQNIFYNIMRNRSILPRNDLSKPFLFFWIISLISLMIGFFFKGYGRSALYEFRIVLYSLLLPITLNVVSDRRKLDIILNGFLLGCIPLGLIVLYNLLRTNIIIDLRYAAATHYASGRQSLFLSFAFIYFLVQSLTGKGKNTLNVILMSITSLLVVVSQNRTVYLSLPFGMIILYFLLNKKARTTYWKLLVRFIIIGCLLLLVLNFFHSGLLIKRILKSGGGIVKFQEDLTGTFRLFVWIQEISKIQKNPWLGEYFGSSFQFWAPSGELFKQLDPHNAYITIALKIGLIGLVAFLGIVLTFYRECLKYLKIIKNHQEQGIILFILVALADLLVYIGFNAELENTGSGVFIWILIGMGLFFMSRKPPVSKYKI
jgi:O-antigen ligase